MIKHTEYTSARDFNTKTIALTGLKEDELSKILTNAIFQADDEHLFIKDKAMPDGNKNDKLIQGNDIIDPCTICEHRVRKVSEGCRTCSFKPKKNYSFEEPDIQPLISFLDNEEATKLSPHHVTTFDASFQEMFYDEDISFDDDTIDENKRRFSERAKKGVWTKKFKKDHCATCVFSDEKNRCIRSHPEFCQTDLYENATTIRNKTLPLIKNKEKLLQLSLLCGNTIKYNNVRYRISLVQDEAEETFLLTRDYSPWSEITVTLSDILKIQPAWKEIVEYKKPIQEFDETTKDDLAITMALLRKNWDNIYRIESYQNQHMFWASINTRKKEVDIAIHLSKNCYEYSYKNPEELAKTTLTIHV